ncbi:LysE family transporter [Fictibacillus phosphorivorans]|uniref:LysE family transporter n=1 Tax=Fictibacillus phosphorivorans TaxID=1221500 RepID=UPI00203C49BD|nr:LysE family transporter [Fictibacillus phosphorivorans]MCM3719255.1 LysE family translocator [Fictibacillus phosphorivorans]MCM3776877.1 LysE family translocator [Fictibacillus phosphorivorans]
MSEFWLLSLHFMMLGISLAIPVGPIKLEMIKRGLSGGFWPSWLVGLGAVSADFIFMLIVFLGLSPFLQNHFVQIVMLVVGIIMLIVLGISTIKTAWSEKTMLILNEETPSQQPYWTGFTIALMNPINFLFWLGIYGGTLQDMPTNELWIQALLSLMIIAGIILWNINVAFAVHFFRLLINDRSIRVLTGLAGAGLLVFAYHLLVQLVKQI